MAVSGVGGVQGKAPVPKSKGQVGDSAFHKMSTSLFKFMGELKKKAETQMKAMKFKLSLPDRLKAAQKKLNGLTELSAGLKKSGMRYKGIKAACERLGINVSGKGIGDAVVKIGKDTVTVSVMAWHNYPTYNVHEVKIPREAYDKLPADLKKKGFDYDDMRDALGKMDGKKLLEETGYLDTVAYDRVDTQKVFADYRSMSSALASLWAQWKNLMQAAYNKLG